MRRVARNASAASGSLVRATSLDAGSCRPCCATTRPLNCVRSSTNAHTKTCASSQRARARKFNRPTGACATQQVGEICTCGAGRFQTWRHPGAGGVMRWQEMRQPPCWQWLLGPPPGCRAPRAACPPPSLQRIAKTTCVLAPFFLGQKKKTHYERICSSLKECEVPLRRCFNAGTVWCRCGVDCGV